MKPRFFGIGVTLKTPTLAFLYIAEIGFNLPSSPGSTTQRATRQATEKPGGRFLLMG